MSRRISLLASGAVIIAPLALSACGSSGNVTATPTPTPSTSSAFQDQFGSQTSTLFTASANSAEPAAVTNSTVPALDPTIEPKDN